MLFAGYIPHRQYNYGESYNDDCSTCIKKLLTERHENEVKFNRVRAHVDRSVHLKPIADNDEVLARIKRYTSVNQSEDAPLLQCELCYKRQ